MYLRPSGDPADCPTCRFLGSHMTVQFDKLRSVSGTHEFGILAVLTDDTPNHPGTSIYAGVFNSHQTTANGRTRMVVECNNNGHAEMMVSDDINPNAPDPEKTFALSVEMTVGSACKLNNGCNELRARWQCRYQRPSVTTSPLVISGFMSEEEHPFSLQTKHVVHGVTSNDNSVQNYFDVKFAENAAHTMGPIDGANGAPFVPYNRIDKGTYGDPVAPRCQPACDGSLVHGWTETDNYHPLLGISASGSLGPGNRIKMYGSSSNSSEFRMCMNEGLPGSPCQPTPTPTRTTTPTPTPTVTPTPQCPVGSPPVTLPSLAPTECQPVGSNWCWAVVLRHIINLETGSTPSLCDIVSIANWPFGCPLYVFGDPLVQNLALEQYGVSAGLRASVPPIEELTRSLDNGHEIPITVLFDAGWTTFHVMVITGYACDANGHLVFTIESNQFCSKPPKPYDVSYDEIARRIDPFGEEWDSWRFAFLYMIN